MRVLRNILAAIGALSIVAIAVWAGSDFVTSHFLCEKHKGQISAVARVKASVYQFECGAMAGTRTHIVLSHPDSDGLWGGDTVLTLLHVGDVKSISLEWTTDRELRVLYPASSEIEYWVGKTRGVRVEPAPQPSTQRNVGTATPQSGKVSNGCKA